MVATPILGSSYVTRSPNAADSRMVNLFPEIVPEGGKQPAWLQRAPGLRFIASMGLGPMRGLWTFYSDEVGSTTGNKVNYAYAVSGETLYRIDTEWNYTAIGTIAGTTQVNMTDNGRQMFIAAGDNGYIYNSTYNRTAFNTTNTSTTVTNGDTTYVYVGQPVSGTGIPVGATVASVAANGTDFTLSADRKSTRLNSSHT